MRTKAICIAGASFLTVGLVIGLTACNLNNTGDVQTQNEDVQTSDVPATATPDAPEDSTESQPDQTEASYYNPLEKYDLPRFMAGAFEMGTYENPTRIANPGSYSIIEYTEDNKLDIPECSVLCVLYHRIGGSVYELYEQDDDQIEAIFGLIKSLEWTKLSDAETRGPQDPQQDTSVSASIMLANSDYALIDMSSFEDDYIEMLVTQESAPNDTVCYGTFSPELREILRKIMDMKEGSLDIIRNADSVKYLPMNGTAKKGEWLTLDPDKIMKLAEITSSAEEASGFDGGCSFNEVLIEADGAEYRGAYTTDGCGYIVIEDKVFKIPDELNDKYQKSIFITEVFTDGWESWLKQ